MYSFGRKNAYNPFFGGMVKESVDTGTFKRFTENYRKDNLPADTVRASLKDGRAC